MNKTDDALNPMLPMFIFHLPIIWFILGGIGFIGNSLVFLPLKRSSRTSDVYLFCGSIVDVIILSINLYLMYFLAILNIGKSSFSIEAIVICGTLIFLILPHLSINLLLMAYFDRLVCTCKPGSSLHKLTRFKIIPWIISLIFICSCLSFSYLPTVYLISSHNEHNDGKIHVYIASILYILTNGLIPTLLMLVVILVTYRNVRKSRHNSKAVINETNSNNLRNRFIIIIMAQVLTTAIISITWTCLYFVGIILADDNQSTIMTQVVGISFYCYHLNNVKSFYVSILVAPTFRERFIRACVNLASCLTCQRRRFVNTNNSTRIRSNNREEIPLQSV